MINMRKIGKTGELFYILGVTLCAFGVVLTTKADFGLSMMSAPSYILSTALSESNPWLTQGVAEYFWQGLLLLTMCILTRSIRPRFLLSLISSIFFGLCIDGWIFVLGGNGPYGTLMGRIISFIAGEIIICFAVSLMYRTYIPQPITECLVVETSRHFKAQTPTVKLINDFSCLVFSISLALLLTHSLTGIGIGTVIITVVNAPLIRLISKIIDRFFDPTPAIPFLSRLLRREESDGVQEESVQISS